jgi:hypothetical protein
MYKEQIGPVLYNRLAYKNLVYIANNKTAQLFDAFINAM